MNRRVRIILSICSIITFSGIAFIGYILQTKNLIFSGAILGAFSVIYGAFALRGPKEYHVEKPRTKERRPEQVPKEEVGRPRRKKVTRAADRDEEAKRNSSFSSQETTPVLAIQGKEPLEDSYNEQDLDAGMIKVTLMVAGMQRERNKFNLQQVLKQLIADKYYKNYGRGMRNREIEEDYEVGKLEEGEYRWAMDGRRLPYVRLQEEQGKKLVKVMASYYKEYFKQIGQIPSAKAGQILKMMKTAQKYKVIAILKGGQYKYVEDHFSADSNGDSLKVISNTIPYEVELTITFKM